MMGTILRVDLSNHKVEKEIISRDMREKYAGGRGLNVNILFAMGQGTDDFSYENLVELYSLATGIEADMASMFTTAERVFNLERSFSCREGLRRPDDHLKGKWSHGPVPSGSFKGKVLEKDKWEIMLDDYYRLRGWDKNGVPTSRKLQDLDIEYVADSLKASGDGENESC